MCLMPGLITLLDDRMCPPGHRMFHTRESINRL